MIGLLLAAALVATPVFGEDPNLIENPGFEETLGEDPKGWDVFVLPQTGAYGRIDGEALSGRFSVSLQP